MISNLQNTVVFKIFTKIASNMLYMEISKALHSIRVHVMIHLLYVQVLEENRTERLNLKVINIILNSVFHDVIFAYFHLMAI